ncbi:MAG: hypothetical protein LBM08_05620 [Dysgonamonadaceae bacterium]|jgi:hypothetical protein|nr:hypothetical protein [Dysgonamonadaceae bacterium]
MKISPVACPSNEEVFDLVHGTFLLWDENTVMRNWNDEVIAIDISDPLHIKQIGKMQMTCSVMNMAVYQDTLIGRSGFGWRKPGLLCPIFYSAEISDPV